MRCGVSTPHLVTKTDRQATGCNYDQQQQQGGDIDHRLGCLYVGGLEAHVKDMEAQVHELAIHVKERELGIKGQGLGENDKSQVKVYFKDEVGNEREALV